MLHFTNYVVLYRIRFVQSVDPNCFVRIFLLTQLRFEKIIYIDIGEHNFRFKARPTIFQTTKK